MNIYIRYIKLSIIIKIYGFAQDILSYLTFIGFA